MPGIIRVEYATQCRTFRDPEAIKKELMAKLAPAYEPSPSPAPSAGYGYGYGYGSKAAGAGGAGASRSKKATPDVNAAGMCGFTDHVMPY